TSVGYPPTTNAPLEERLAEHLESVVHYSTNAVAVQSRIREAVGDQRNLEVVNFVAKTFHNPDLAKRITLFAPFWVRRPQTWKNKGATSFLDHQFVRHAVPAFLYADWFRLDDSTRLKWLCWFILFGQGGSLKRAAEIFRWKIPARFPHYLQEARAQASP